MISVLLSRLVLLVCGTLYPAYASYKTVKTKNVRDYVHWMMYWIVFAGYTFVEIFTDVFLSFWFPFYYELKIIFVLWLVCPSRGSTYLFRKVINPQMSKYELVIDSYVAATWIHGYDFIRKIGAQVVEYLIEIIFELLRRGQITVNTFMPEVPADAQNIVVRNIEHHKKHPVSAVTEIDEDFISMTDNSEVDEAVPSNITDNPPNESCSESEEISEKTQSSKMKTRSKKVTVRERRKIMK